jgi:hypothetical protein
MDDTRGKKAISTSLLTTLLIEQDINYARKQCNLDYTHKKATALH